MMKRLEESTNFYQHVDSEEILRYNIRLEITKLREKNGE